VLCMLCKRTDMSPSRLFDGYRKAGRLTRGLFFRIWLRVGGGRAGPGLQVEKGAIIRGAPHKGIVIGRGAYLGRGVILDVRAGGTLIIGERAKIMHYTILAVTEWVEIGRLTQIAEHCSVRDADHGTETGTPMWQQEITTPVKIGNDVWVARGVAILRGSKLGDGCVIGANSVVRGEVPMRAIAVGAPVRIVKFRDDS
jgi:acetyltransferase-like isoleucine patch superfamily enzyme